MSGCACAQQVPSKAKAAITKGRRSDFFMVWIRRKHVFSKRESTQCYPTAEHPVKLLYDHLSVVAVFLSSIRFATFGLRRNVEERSVQIFSDDSANSHSLPHARAFGGLLAGK